MNRRTPTSLSADSIARTCSARPFGPLTSFPNSFVRSVRVCLRSGKEAHLDEGTGAREIEKLAKDLEPTQY